MSELSPADLVCFPTEGPGLIAADFWGGGSHGLLLVNAENTDESPWRNHIAAFVDHGLTVMEPTVPRMAHSSSDEAVDLLARIVAGAVAYLRIDGAQSVSILANSTGASAAAEAVLGGLVGNIHTLILLAPERLSGPIGLIANRVIFVVADSDVGTELAVRQRSMAPDTTQLTVFTGDMSTAELFESAHARSLQKLILEALPAGGT